MIVLDFQDFIHQYINRVNIEIYGLIKKEISLKIEEENFFFGCGFELTLNRLNSFYKG